MMIMFSGMVLDAQDFKLPDLSNYQHNWMILNPAFAGSREAASLNMLLRTKPGPAGGPLFEQISGHTPINTGNVALGGTVYTKQTPDENFENSINETTISATYAYRVSLDPGRLAFGLSAGIIWNGYGGITNLLNTGDNAFQSASGLMNRERYFMPNIAAGVLYYTEKMFAGVSIPQFTSINEEGKTDFSYLSYSPILMGGYEQPVSDNFTINPNGFLQYELRSGTWAYAASLNFAFWKETIWLGAIYKAGNRISINANFITSPDFMFGLSWDYSLDKTTTYFQNSFELIFRYEFRETVENNIPFYY